MDIMFIVTGGLKPNKFYKGGDTEKYKQWRFFSDELKENKTGGGLNNGGKN